MLLTIGFSMLTGSVLLILLSLILTVIWRVPSLIDELSGRKAKRQIERMRKLNIATGGLDVNDTEEFYKALNASSSNNSEPDFSSISEINKMVDDPYNSVKNIKRGIKNNSFSNNPTENYATEMFKDVPEVLNIKIIDEQSSLS